MSYILLFSEVTLGGDGSNNPVPLTIANYYLTGTELTTVFRQVNVIVFDKTLQVNLQVSGLAEIDPRTGLPMTNSNDPVRLPCPPFCT